MRRRSRPVLLLLALLFVCGLSATTPAFGAWRSISTMVYDDGGRTCRNIAHFSMAHQLPLSQGLRPTDTSLAFS